MIERPFNLPAQTKQKGIFIAPRGGFVPPVASPRAVYVATRGQWHAGSVEEEVAKKWTPYAFVSVAQHGGLGRFIAHNKVVGPLTPNLTLVGDRVYVRNEYELSCFGYTGDEGKAYEAEANAATILEDVSDEPPPDAEGAALWKQGILYARPFLEKAIALKPECAAAKRAKTLLQKAK